MMKNLIVLMLILTLGFSSWGQDFHYADIQTMNLWYNQSLKLDRHADLRLKFRDVTYNSILAFRTASGLLNIPLIKRNSSNSTDRKGFMNLTAGGAFDKSNKGSFKNSTGLVGLSYSQLLSDNFVYLSAGFQGSITQTNLGTLGMSFPDQFDQFGPLSSANSDP